MTFTLFRAGLDVQDNYPNHAMRMHGYVDGSSNRYADRHAEQAAGARPPECSPAAVAQAADAAAPLPAQPASDAHGMRPLSAWRRLLMLL